MLVDKVPKFDVQINSSHEDPRVSFGVKLCLSLDRKIKMARICLIGDSNIYRHASAPDLSKRSGGVVQLYSCTKEVTFDSLIEGTKRDNFHVIIISVISNFIEQLGEEGFKNDYQSFLERFCAKLLGLTPKVLVVPPILHHSPAWFRENYPAMQLGLIEIGKQYSNLLLLPEFKVMPGDLKADSMHLTKAAGGKLMDYLISALQDLDSSGFISALPEVLNSSDEALRMLKTQVVPQLKLMSKTDEKVTALSKFVNEKSTGDDMMFCKLREESDFQQNLDKANRVVFVNVDSQGKAIPERLVDYKNQLSNLIRPVVNSVMPDTGFEVLPRRGPLRSGIYPPFEVRLPSRQQASTFRRLVKVRTFKGFEKTVLAPSVTLATRVRFEVLKAICLKLSDPSAKGYSPMFSLRPLLHLGPEVNGKVVTRTTLLYPDAV